MEDIVFTDKKLPGNGNFQDIETPLALQNMQQRMNNIASIKHI